MYICTSMYRKYSSMAAAVQIGTDSAVVDGCNNGNRKKKDATDILVARIAMNISSNISMVDYDNDTG